jgi:hypothetical protein
MVRRTEHSTRHVFCCVDVIKTVGPKGLLDARVIAKVEVDKRPGRNGSFNLPAPAGSS